MKSHITELQKHFPPKKSTSGQFTTRTGNVIYYGQADPVGTSKGTIILTTGGADFIHSYFEFMNICLDAGYSIRAMDWVGQGNSAKLTASRDGKSQTIYDNVEDLHQFRHSIADIDEDKPVFLVTHSMGGQIGMLYMNKYKHDFDKAIVAAPFFERKRKKINFKKPFKALKHLRTLFGYAASHKWHMTVGNPDSALRHGRKEHVRDLLKTRAELYKEDPVRMNLHRVHGTIERGLLADNFTHRFIDSLLDTTKKVNQLAFQKNIDTPILFVVAGQDEQVENEPIRQAAQTMTNAELLEIPNAIHNVYHERAHIQEILHPHIFKFLASTPKNNQKPVPKASDINIP